MATDPNAAIYDAIRQADAAGDSASVARLAGYLKQTQPSAQADMTPQPTATLGADGRYTLDPGGSDAPPPPKPASVADQVKYGLGVGTRDVLGGAGQLLNFVQSPIAAIWNGLGGHAADYEGLADTLADKIGLPRGEEGDHVGKAFRRGVVSGLLTAGAAAPVAGAATAGSAAKGIATALSEAPFVQSVASGAGSASSEVAREAGLGPVGQTVAGLAGGGLTAGALVGVPAGARAAMAAAKDAVEPFTQEGALNRAATVLQRSRTIPVGDIEENIATAPAPVEGVRPTLAEVSRDPGLAGLQRGHANSDTNTGAAIGERHASNMLARDTAVQGALGDGQAQSIQDYGVQQVSQAEQATAKQQAERRASVDQRVTAAHAAATEGRTVAEQGLQDSIAGLGPVADRDATGASAREAFDNAYAAAKQRSNEAYSAPVLKQPQPVKIADRFFQQMRSTLDNFYGDGGGYVPEGLKTILDDSAADGATTRTLTNIDRRLADFAGSARMAGNRSDAAVAEQIRGNLASFVQKATSPEYRAALANAKQVRADQGRVFETGDAPAAFARDRYNNPTVGNNTLPTRLLRPGAAGGDTAEGLIAAVGPQAAEGVVRQEIRRAAEEANIQTERQARTFAVKYAEAARRFPSVQSDLSNLTQQAARADAARDVERDALRAGATPEEDTHVSELSALQSAIEKTPLARVSNNAIDPTAFVGQLLRKDDAGRQFRFLARQVASSDEASGGLRRALGDYINSTGAGPSYTAAGDRIPSINNTRKAIATVVDRAGEVLSGQQKIVLKKVSRELESANFAATAARPAGSDTVANRTFRNLVDNVPNDKAKMLLNRVLANLDNTNDVKDLITRSVLDPDFAVTLLKRPTPKHWDQIKSGLLAQKAASLGTSVVASNLHPSLSSVSAFVNQPKLAAQDQNQGEGR